MKQIGCASRRDALFPGIQGAPGPGACGKGMSFMVRLREVEGVVGKNNARWHRLRLIFYQSTMNADMSIAESLCLLQ
jgi:hypothetical protein